MLTRTIILASKATDVSQNGDTIAIIFTSIIALVGGIIALAFYFERKRRAALRAVAEAMQFSFDHTGASVPLSRLSAFPIMNRGSTRTLTNAMTGSAQGIAVSIFDYSYVTGSGKNRTTRSMTVASFHVPGLRLPSFTLQPEGFFHRLGAMFGMQDIDFPAHPDFSRAFLLRGSDETGIRRLFDEGLIGSLQSVKKICVEGAGDRFVVFRTGTRVKPEDVSGFLAEGFGVFCYFTDSAARNGLS